MGFVTESSMRTDYLTLFYETLKENKKVGGLEVSDNYTKRNTDRSCPRRNGQPEC